MSWKLIHHTPGFVKLFQEPDNGRFSVADDSGPFPDQTDDYQHMGDILWIDVDRPLKLVDFFQGVPLFKIHLQVRGNDTVYAASLDMGAAWALSQLTNMAMIIDYGRPAFEITPMTARDSAPLQDLAQQALDVQSACNIAGVAGLLQRVHSSLRIRLKSTSDASRHVIIRAIVDKLVDMTHMEGGRISRGDMVRVQDLADGKLTALEAMNDSVQ